MMCGRLSQYRGIHDFVAALGMPGAMVNRVGEQALGCYNAAPTMQLALLHVAGDTLHADTVRWGWRPHWAKDRTVPINARIEKVAHGPFYRQIWPHRAICPIDSWFEWVDEGSPKKQPYLIRHRDGSPIFCTSIGQLPGLDEGHGQSDGFVIITANAQGGMVDIHDRRPVVLSPKGPGNGWTRQHQENAPNRWRCSKGKPQRPSSGSRSAPPWAMFETTGRNCWSHWQTRSVAK